MKTVCGIDPGASGAIAIYDGGELLIYDMPVYYKMKGKTSRKMVDFEHLNRILRIYKKIDHVFIENVSAQFGNGASAAFSFGWSCACVENAVISAFLPYTYVTPQTWKKAMQCPADKDESRRRAGQLLPQFKHNWDRKKDDGRAEAALIALYGYNK